MEFEEVIKKRQSIRKFVKKEIPEEKIRKILELANLSPSAGNLQARKVVLVKDKKIKQELARAALSQESVSEAPVVFVVCADLEESAKKYGMRGRELYAIQDATIFASYLQLVAVSLGLASCWAGSLREEEIKRILGLSGDLRPIAIIPIGYPAEGPYRTPRKSLDEIVIPKNHKGRRNNKDK
jgi:nitroreductase